MPLLLSGCLRDGYRQCAAGASAPPLSASTNEQRIIDYRRAASFKNYRQGSLAGNVPVVLVTNGESEAKFVCRYGSTLSNWTKNNSDAFATICRGYGYPDRDQLLTCQCFPRASDAVERPFRPPRVLQVGGQQLHPPAGPNLRFDPLTESLQSMADKTRVDKRNDDLNGATASMSVIMGPEEQSKFNNYATLIGYTDQLMPCCPWFELQPNSDGTFFSSCAVAEDGSDASTNPCFYPPRSAPAATGGPRAR